MIRGYVSSDEDDYDDYDFGYSEPLTVRKDPPSLPEIQTPEIKEKLYSALEESQKIELFIKAVEEGNLETVENFLSHGLSADSTDLQGWTALMKACGEGNSVMVQFLLDNGADANKKRELFTPLMTCCTYTLVAESLKLDCVRLLLQHGADVNARDKYRTTALMYAAISGYENIVSELLEFPGIDINIQDKDGWTVLFHAVFNNMINIVVKLMNAKADLNLKDKCERTALSLALDRDHHELAKILGFEEKKPKKKKKTQKIKILNQLPNANGKGGFSHDSFAFLAAFGINKTKKISFFDLLNATEDDLSKIGIKLEFDRKKLLSKGIHQYHLQPWKVSSMQQINWKVPLCLEEMIHIVASLAKHLTIANASLKYVDSRISSWQNKELSDRDIEKEMIIFSIKSYKAVEKLKILLQKIILNIEKMKSDIQGDYVYPYKSENEREKSRKFFWPVVGAATVGFLIFYYKPFPNFKSFMKFSSLVDTSSLLYLFQSEVISGCLDEALIFMGN